MRLEALSVGNLCVCGCRNGTFSRTSTVLGGNGETIGNISLLWFSIESICRRPYISMGTVRLQFAVTFAEAKKKFLGLWSEPACIFLGGHSGGSNSAKCSFDWLPFRSGSTCRMVLTNSLCTYVKTSRSQFAGRGMKADSLSWRMVSSAVTSVAALSFWTNGRYHSLPLPCVYRLRG